MEKSTETPVGGFPRNMMKLSPKQAGKLYQKSMAQEEEIKKLKSFLQDSFDEFNRTGHLSTKTCLKGAELL